MLFIATTTQAKTLTLVNNTFDESEIVWFSIVHYEKVCTDTCVMALPQVWMTGRTVWAYERRSITSDLLTTSGHDYWQVAVLKRRDYYIELYDTIWVECDIAASSYSITVSLNKLNNVAGNDITITSNNVNCEIKNQQVRYLDLI